LEARVELLSGNKEEIVYEMRMMLKGSYNSQYAIYIILTHGAADLMEENASLRALVKGLSTFIGEGSGGMFLQNLGWSMDEFNDFVGKNTSDSAYESFQRHKANAAKRRASDTGEPSGAGPSKRARNSSDTAGYGADMYGTFRPTQPTPPSGVANSQDASLFSQLVRGAGQPMYVPPATQHGYGAGPSTSSPGTYAPSGGSYMSPLSLDMTSPLNSHPPATSHPHAHQQGYGPDPTANEDHSDVDPKVDEAGKLIHYHLENYGRNSKYHLPASLRPTDVQQKIPHNRMIDGILIPGIRDHMILLQGMLDRLLSAYMRAQSRFRQI
jgi:hypothetical protein